MECDHMPLKQRSSRTNTTREIIYSDFSGGNNYRDNPSLIAGNQTPECQNVRIRDGTINKRPGYKRLYQTSLGDGKINGIGIYKKANGTIYRLIAHSTNLYTQSGNDQPVLLKSGIANAKASFFTLSDTFYIKNGTDFLSFDGTTCNDVIGYIPTVLLGRSPSGSPNAGTSNESFNLLSAGFKISFSSDGSSTVYKIPYTNLDTTPVVVIVEGVTKTLTTDYTVNFTTGEITFSVAPVLGNPDNVVITAYKASLSHPEYIKNCTKATVYGGKTSATVFLSGNPNFPDQIWHSRLYGYNYSADYWPDDAWQKAPGNVMDMSHIYDLLYVAHSNGHGYLSYTDGPSGYPIFPYSDINLVKGSDIPGSLQGVDNTVVCASTTNGVMQVVADTTVNNYMSVKNASDLINMGSVQRTDLGLLRQSNLKNAVSYNFDGYYGLCVNNICYVWDYRLNAWLYDTNIPASCFATIDNTLCFGSNTVGLIFQFDPSLASDDEILIDSWYDTKEDDTGLPENIKVVNTIFMTAKPLNQSSVGILFLSRESAGDIVLNMATSAFSYANFSYVNFTYNTSFYPVIKKKRMSKRANVFKFRFRNNTLNEGMSVISLRVMFDIGTAIR